MLIFFFVLFPPVSLLSFLHRNDVQLTIDLSELKLSILAQISHSSSILTLIKMCILQKKPHILFEISFTLWLGLKQVVRAWNPKCCVQHRSCHRPYIFVVLKSGGMQAFTTKIPQVSQILCHYQHTPLKVSLPKKPISKYHQSSKSTNEDLLITGPKRQEHVLKTIPQPLFSFFKTWTE